MRESISSGYSIAESVSRISTIFLFYIFVLIIASFSGFIFGNGMSSEYVFIPVQIDLTASVSDLFLLACNILRSSVVQCLIFFLGGLFIRPMFFPGMLACYRGYCIGCVLSLYCNSSLHSDRTPLALLLYFVATVVLLIFSSLATFALKRRIAPGSFHGKPYGKIYFSVFLLTSGIVFLLYCIPFWIS